MTAASQPVPHSVRVEPMRLGTPHYRAACTCGWYGPAMRDRRDAVDDQDEHRADPDRVPAWIFYDPQCAPIEYLRRSHR
jgi:hypothetical protein